MRAYERFLKYAKIHTTSAEEQGGNAYALLYVEGG